MTFGTPTCEKFKVLPNRDRPPTRFLSLTHKLHAHMLAREVHHENHPTTHNRPTEEPS